MKKTLQTNIVVNDLYDTLTQIIRCNVGLKRFFICQNVCLLLSLYNIHAYFTR